MSWRFIRVPPLTFHMEPHLNPENDDDVYMLVVVYYHDPFLILFPWSLEWSREVDVWKVCSRERNNIPHQTGKGKIIDSNVPLGRDMLLPRRVCDSQKYVKMINQCLDSRYSLFNACVWRTALHTKTSSLCFSKFSECTTKIYKYFLLMYGCSFLNHD